MTPTSAVSAVVAYANTGVGSARGSRNTSIPAPLKISALSIAYSAEPYLASRPITTRVIPRAFI